MADNTTLPGTGDIIGADDVSGVKYQIVKVGFGALDAAPTLVASGAGFPVDSELPAAAALADGTANPTAPLVGAANETWNGTTWDRAKSAAAAANTTGTGLPGSGVLGFDGTNYQLVKVSTAGVQHVLPAFTEQASLTAGALNADLVPSTDVSAYKSISVQVTAAATSGTLTFQGSNDNSTFVSVVMNPLATVSPTPVTTTATAGIWTGPVSFRYFRVRMTTYSSGSATGVAELSAAPYVYPSPSNLVAAQASNGIVVQPLNFSSSDATANSGIATYTTATPFTHNGTSWDRLRGNMDVAVLASAARTTTQTGADTTNYNGRGVRIVLDTTVASTGSVTLSIQGKDANGVYYTLLSGAAVTTVSTNVYEVFPGATVTANVSANTLLPRVWRVVVTANNANTQTYSVSSCVIL